MGATYNIYCDESCHLENDGQTVMVLGAIWCSQEKTRRIAEEIRNIKIRHSLPPKFEIKWTKISPAKINFYLDIVNYFSDNADLGFRAVVIPDKSKLRHEDFRQDHDDWYYKMYFNLLKVILKTSCEYYVYLDIKDTRSAAKAKKLQEILRNNIHDFSGNIIKNVQNVHSREVEQIQLVDLLIGAVCYINRNQIRSRAKKAVVDQITKRTGHSLTQKTPREEEKCNIFIWQAQEDN